MRQKKVWRYYCDHCRKAGCSKGALAKHERGCTRNEDRVCGMCAKAELAQHPMPELLAALEQGGTDAVLALALGCPACVVAAIHALRKIEPLYSDPETGDHNYIDFDYTKAATAFWKELNAREEYR